MANSAAVKGLRRSDRAGLTRVSMQRTRIVDALAGKGQGSQIAVAGWVRTVRVSKGGFSFVALNDGSCFDDLQVVAAPELPNYDSEIAQAHGRVQRGGRGQAGGQPGQGADVELQAGEVRDRWAGPTPRPTPSSRSTTRSSSCARRPTCGRGPTPSGPSPACATRCARPSTSSSRRAASCTSTRRSSPPATAKGPARCSASPRWTWPTRRATARRAGGLRPGLLRPAGRT